MTELAAIDTGDAPVWRTPTTLLVRSDYSRLLGAVGAAGGADLIVTSPPYDDARTYGDAVSWQFADYQRLGDAVAGALKPGGHALVVLDGPVRATRAGFGTERSFTPWRVMLDWADRVGLRVPDRLAYARSGAPGAFAGRFRNDWEPLLWFQRRGAPGYFNKWEISDRARGFSSRSTVVRRADGSHNRRRASGKNVLQQRKHRGTLWDYGVASSSDDPSLSRTGHPARFVLRFAIDAVLCFSPPGALVVDPFSGSGTTAVAATRFGRAFAGSDSGTDGSGKPWAEVSHERAAAERARRP